MDTNPEVGFSFGNVIELSERGAETPTRSIIRAANDAHTRILKGSEFIELSGSDNLVPTCSAVVRTDLQKRLGGYRNELPHTGDMEMWLRFAAHASVGFIPACQGVYRQHRGNMSTVYYSIANGHVLYAKNGRLADLRQRKSALDYFAKHCRDLASQRVHLCSRLYRRLAELAVSHASSAFNDGEIGESSQLSGFALAVCPEIKRSSAWIKLACKRRMGARTWRAVRPAATLFRAMQHN
jgi:hypothetical protein